MNDVCQQVMSDTSAQNQRLIQQALADLNERLSTLENEAQQKEQELVERSRQHKLFQVSNVVTRREERIIYPLILY